MYSLLLFGKRSLELQKWRNLKFTLTLYQNASPFSNSFSSTTASDTIARKGKNFTTSYLVQSLGLTPKLAESISKKVSFIDSKTPDSVLNLMRTYGFTNSQISTIVIDYPQLLKLDAEKSIEPKLKLLLSKGASNSELTKILSQVPMILGKKSVSVYYDSAKCIIEADKSYLSQESNLENKIRNVLVLRELGMPQSMLLHLLVSNSQPICGKENFNASLKKVVEMGFDPTTKKFILALRMLYQMSEKTIEEKIKLYQSLGFSVEDIWERFKRCPTFLKLSKSKIMKGMETYVELGFSMDEIMAMVKLYPGCIEYSEESIKKKIEILLKEINWSFKAVASHPQIVGYSMEKRIVPRCNVIKVLMSKGLIGKGSEPPSVSAVFSCTDESFLKTYVLKTKYEKVFVAQLMDILNNAKGNLKDEL